MYLSRKQFNDLMEIKNNMVNDRADKKVIEKLDSILFSVLEKTKKENKKTALYIAEKRKVNKNYARENKRK